MTHPMPLQRDDLPPTFLALCDRYGLVTQRQALDAVEAWLEHPERRPAHLSADAVEALRIQLAAALPEQEAQAAPDFQPPPAGVITARPLRSFDTGRIPLADLPAEGSALDGSPDGAPDPDESTNQGGH